jgi:hypothetical protein
MLQAGVASGTGLLDIAQRCWIYSKEQVRCHNLCSQLCAVLLLLQAGDASGTGLLDVAQRCWDERLTAMIDNKLLACLPRLIGPNEVRLRTLLTLLTLLTQLMYCLQATGTVLPKAPEA